MRALRSRYSIPAMSRLLHVSAAGYYAWMKRPPSLRAREDERLKVEIKAAHMRTRETCSAERLQKDLAVHGIEVGVSRIRRIRKELGIRCKQKRRFKATTDSAHDLPVADNLLKQNFHTDSPGKVWVSDITYIPTAEGWLYLAGHKDLFNGEIVGYALSSRITRQLVIASLYRGVLRKKPGAGLIHHSDRGSQYCAGEYRTLLEQFGMKPSMSRKGNCYDNAPIESFWGTIKQELTHHRSYRTRQEAITDITEYIEIFYNRQRRQARLGYLSPAEYEKEYYKKNLAA